MKIFFYPFKKQMIFNSNEIFLPLELLRSQSADKKNKSPEVVKEKPTSPLQPPPPPPSQATVVINEKLKRAMDKPHRRMNEKNSSEVPGTSEAFDEIPWPIGVPWVPEEFDKNNKPKHKQEKSELAKVIFHYIFFILLF